MAEASSSRCRSSSSLCHIITTQGQALKLVTLSAIEGKEVAHLSRKPIHSAQMPHEGRESAIAGHKGMRYSS